MYTEILTSHGLSETQWNNNLFSEYLGQLWWKNVMGSSSDSVIQVYEDLTKKAGDTIKIGLRGQMQGGKVTGNAKALGNEGAVYFHSQSIAIDNVRHVVKVEDIPMSQKRVGFNLLTQVKEALQDKASRDLDNEITTQLCDSTSRIQGRYVYGAIPASNWSATHATALATVDATNDLLTSAMIDISKRYAKLPVSATQKIRPTKVKVGQNFEEWYIFVGHTYAMRDLVNNDAAFRNSQLLLPPSANRDSVLFSGSAFKGSWSGVAIYEYEGISLETNSNSVVCAHNLLLGAQAGAVVWGQRSKFGEEFTDLGHDVSYETHEIRGVDKMYFTRTDAATAEDQGLIHVFTSATAD
jgi:N4-gp56 family major capsid protein